MKLGFDVNIKMSFDIYLILMDNSSFCMLICSLHSYSSNSKFFWWSSNLFIYKNKYYFTCNKICL